MNPPKPIYLDNLDPDTLLEMKIILSKTDLHFHPVCIPKPVYLTPQLKEE